MPFGLWSFPLAANVVSHTGPCVGAFVPPAVMSTEQFAGGFGWQYRDPAHGFIATVDLSGTVAHLLVQQSGPQDWTLIDVDMVWSNASASWKKTATRTRVSGSACTQTIAFEWTPKALMGEQWQHNATDELTAPGGDVWRWYPQAGELPLHKFKALHNGGQQWERHKQRGLVFKSGSQAGPDVLDNWVWWGVNGPPGY